MDYGCDHHGSGARPCSCDFCKSGKKLSNKIIKERSESQSAFGLNLSVGPDPRSYNVHASKLNEIMRGLFGMDE